MTHPRPRAPRGHLRLATAPVERSRRDGKAVLFIAAFAAALALFVETLVAWASTALALAPLLRRRAPLCGRLRPIRAPEARIIKLQRRRKALPR